MNALQSFQTPAEDRNVTTSFKAVGATVIGTRDNLTVVIVPGQPWTWISGGMFGTEDDGGIVTWADGSQTESTDAMAEIADDLNAWELR